MIIEYMDFITRSYVQQNRHKTFIFGDNLAGEGRGGQAKEMRGEPNTIGVPTKYFASTVSSAYFSDEDFLYLTSKIDHVFIQIRNQSHIVIPKAGVGTGLAKLADRAPLILKYINDKFKELEQYVVEVNNK